MRRIPTHLRPRIDTFDFWTGVAYFVLTAVVIALYFVNQNTQSALARQSRDEAARAAEVVSNAQSQYHQCVSSRPTLMKIDAFIAAQRVVADALVANSRANLANTLRSDPLYRVRLANLHRLERAAAAPGQVRFPVPTLAQCVALRTSLTHQR